ncbi:MAG: adventurous gliding motility lipoprotein CglC [Anaeromyxobacter sp.]
MRLIAHALVAVVAAVTLGACQDPDVGRPCRLSWNAGNDPPAPTPQTAAGDYFETGNLGCDDLVCIVSPAPAGARYSSCADATNGVCGYCSKPCVSNRDCSTDKTGLVCDLLLLDPAFVATLDDATRQRYLSDVAFSSYCVVPR